MAHIGAAMLKHARGLRLQSVFRPMFSEGCSVTQNWNCMAVHARAHSDQAGWAARYRLSPGALHAGKQMQPSYVQFLWNEFILAYKMKRQRKTGFRRLWVSQSSNFLFFWRRLSSPNGTGINPLFQNTKNQDPAKVLS